MTLWRVLLLFALIAFALLIPLVVPLFIVIEGVK